MTRLTPIADGWVFCEGFETEWTKSPLTGKDVVVPHNAVDLPFDYFDEGAYQKPFTYQRKIRWQDRFDGREVSLRFEGAMADARVYVNGALATHHPDGYTPFDVPLTGQFADGEALVTVHLDGSENPDIPPFGRRIDYLTYAGLYREVYLKVVDPVSIDRLKIETPNPLEAQKTVSVRCWAKAPAGDHTFQWSLSLVDIDGNVVATGDLETRNVEAEFLFENLKDLDLWDIDSPTVYVLSAKLTSSNSTDTVSQTFGFREAEFTPNGFFLNGRQLKLMGLNRHQSMPYVGYAFGREAQQRDADILKFELGCNIVRTSHYPQSTWFLDRCDEIGLLVLEEIPGWQHIGGEVWQDRAVDNVRAMIERDWNHPSIVLWGVRINESIDDDAFYSRTNALARALDTTRQTGGIRKHVESSLLEDVYTFNDFILGEHTRPGANAPRQPLREPRMVTGSPNDVPYLITEYNGHMFPTKVSDGELRQTEHVLRHLDILNATFGDDRISGCIGWCMFDYNTHADFGSGDRICHHGVMTMFREPKFAAAAYASQRAPTAGIVFEPVTFWARGERNIGGVFPLTILTNVEEVCLQVPGHAPLSFHPDREDFPNLPHPPVVIGKDGTGEGILGKWGSSWPEVEFQGLVGGRVVVSRRFARDPIASRLEVVPDRTTFGADYQELRISIRALDQVDNLLRNIDLSVDINLKGPATLLGPSRRGLRGGATAVWIRSMGIPGRIAVNVDTERFARTSVMVESQNIHG